VGEDVLAIGAIAHRDRELARLVAVELERGEELDVFDGGDDKIVERQARRLGEGLDSHDAGQQGRPLDLVVAEEALF
jgi:hypothetical protein